MALAEVALLVPFLKVDFQDYFKKKLPANPEITVLMGGWLWKLDFQKISNTMALQSWLGVSVCQGLSSVETVVYLWECVVPALAPKSCSDPGWTVSRKKGRNQQRQNKLALGGSESPDAVARCHTWLKDSSNQSFYGHFWRFLNSFCWHSDTRQSTPQWPQPTHSLMES